MIILKYFNKMNIQTWLKESTSKERREKLILLHHESCQLTCRTSLPSESTILDGYVIFLE
jgi:hypothetical protein